MRTISTKRLATKIIRNVGILAISILSIESGAAPKLLENIYLKAGIGAVRYKKFKAKVGLYRGTNNSVKGKSIFNLGAGYKFNDSIRADINFQTNAFKYKGLERQAFISRAVFLNGYYDINLNRTVAPYLTVGIGIGSNKAKDALNTEEFIPELLKGKTVTNFIWNTGAGIKFNLNKNLDIDFGYKYVHLGKAKTKDSSYVIFGSKGGSQIIRAHQIMCSVIFQLNKGKNYV